MKSAAPTEPLCVHESAWAPLPGPITPLDSRIHTESLEHVELHPTIPSNLWSQPVRFCQSPYSLQALNSPLQLCQLSLELADVNRLSLGLSSQFGNLPSIPGYQAGNFWRCWIPLPVFGFCLHPSVISLWQSLAPVRSSLSARVFASSSAIFSGLTGCCLSL